jgi:hypothetical protein
MVLHSGVEPFGTCFIVFTAHSNSAAGGLYVDFYDRNDNLVFRIESAAGSTSVYPIGYLGAKMDGGFIRVFESETAGESSVLTVVK